MTQEITCQIPLLHSFYDWDCVFSAQTVVFFFILLICGCKILLLFFDVCFEIHTNKFRATAFTAKMWRQPWKQMNPMRMQVEWAKEWLEFEILTCKSRVAFNSCHKFYTLYLRKGRSLTLPLLYFFPFLSPNLPLFCLPYPPVQFNAFREIFAYCIVRLASLEMQFRTLIPKLAQCIWMAKTMLRHLRRFCRSLWNAPLKVKAKNTPIGIANLNDIISTGSSAALKIVAISKWFGAERIRTQHVCGIN